MAPLLRQTWLTSLTRLDYDPRRCPQRQVAGPHGFVLQLNAGRHMLKRPTDVTSPAVLQPFNAAGFHFGRVPANETLATFVPAAALNVAGEHRVLFNKTPIGDNHVLLLPFADAARPQALTADALRVALSWCREVDDAHFRLGFNSLGAYASVNHLHFHGYFLQQPATTLPVERAAFAPVGLLAGAAFGRLEYPIATLAFGAEDVGALAAAVAAAADLLQRANVAYNLFVSDRGTRAFLFPQRFGRALAAGRIDANVLALGINPGAFELAGHLIVRDPRNYDEITDAQGTALLAAASSGEAFFSRLLARLGTRRPPQRSAPARIFAPLSRAERGLEVTVGG